MQVDVYDYFFTEEETDKPRQRSAYPAWPVIVCATCLIVALFFIGLG